MPQSPVMKALLLLAALLAACGQAPAPPATNDAAASAPKPAPPAPRAFELNEDNALIEFHFGWPAEAAAVPELVARFRTAMAKERAELLAGAKADKDSREKEGYEFHAYSSSTEYATDGQSPRLLSLSVDVGTYTGGAHGNFGTSSLLWDRIVGKEIKAADLFDPPTRFAALLTKPWCDALNAERTKKREEPPQPGDMFWDCPKLGEIAVIPTDKDGNGRFERFALTASPYVAGPYVEGDYEVESPVSEALIAALKPEYRASFEAHPQ
jgi:hypothetical protein